MALPDYVKRAKNAYNSKFDLIQLKLPKGTKDRIKKIIGEDGSMAAFCADELLEVIAGYEAAASYQQPEEFPEPVPDQEPEPIADPGEVFDPEENQRWIFPGNLMPRSAKDPKEDQKKYKSGPMTPDQMVELQALLDGRRAEMEQKKQEEKEKEAEKERQREEESKAYTEKLLSGWQEIQTVRWQDEINAALGNPRFLEVLRDPGYKDQIIEVTGPEFYEAVLQADKENQRQENIDRAVVEMGQTSKPPF